MKARFYKISIDKTFYFRVPYALCLENQCDFTHFSHLHRKVILDYQLLYKNDKRAIFLYKARRLYPLPFYDTYIVFREMIDNGYHQIYLNVKSGAVHYLKGTAADHGDCSSQKGEFIFCVPWFWSFFPNLFFWIFKKRITKVVDEDYEWFAGRMNSKQEDCPTCAPVVPDKFDLFEELFKNGVMPKADIHFEEDDRNQIFEPSSFKKYK
jgi:hypothetical protein